MSLDNKFIEKIDPDSLWLLTPPKTSTITLPVASKLQLLPFGELLWENFERLCLRMARLEGDAEYWRLYGTSGQKQDGIDIFVRLHSGRYHVWQSKRYTKFSRNHVKVAVKQFLAGKWRDKTDQFVLCVQANLRDTKISDEIEKQHHELKKHGIRFLPLGGDELSERLRSQPEIVDDFFRRVWVEYFCGKEEADKLNPRLTIEEIQTLRTSLREIYHHHFNKADPGFLISSSVNSSSSQQLLLEKRYVIPDILISSPVTTIISHSLESRYHEDRDFDLNYPYSKQPYPESAGTQAADKNLDTSTEVVITRQPVFEWLTHRERSVVLGGPGTGKSSLLRITAIELLSDHPKIDILVKKWGGFLPIWIPFSLWTRLVEKDDKCSLGDVVRAWLERLSAPLDLWMLVQRSLEDKRLILLIDGIDEWVSELAAHTAVNLLQTFIATNHVPVMVSSRPLGFQRLSPFDESWQNATLAPFTKDQQVDLARNWFMHQEQNNFAEPDIKQVTKSEQVALQEADKFINDLHRHTQVAKLAETPLLLWGLISLAIIRRQMPRSRFKAYDQLTEILLSTHPARRRESALEGRERYDLSEDTRKHALAFLAFRTYKDGVEGALSKEVAIETLRSFFKSDLDFSGHEALKAAEEIITAGTETVGILVEKSPKEVGFFHRSF